MCGAARSRLRRQMADVRVPVAERGPRLTAGGVGDPLVERADLADVLGREPHRASGGDGGAVVTPARARRVADQRLVGGEVVRRTPPYRGQVDGPEARSVPHGVAGARVPVG